MHRTEKEKSSKRGNIVFERKDGERVNLESRDVARNGLRGGTDECRDTTWEYMYIERKRKGERVGRLSGSIFYLVTVNWLIGSPAHY